MKKPISPKRVTTKAFLPASEAENFSYQKPIKEIGGQAHQLPGDVQLQEAAADHQGQHGQGEERQVGVKPAEPRVTRHVADGVDLDQPADGGHDHQHHQAGRVQQEPEGHLEDVGDQPVEVVDNGVGQAARLEEKGPGDDQGDGGGRSERWPGTAWDYRLVKIMIRAKANSGKVTMAVQKQQENRIDLAP